MEIFFSESGRRPFILDRDMSWIPEVNHFLHNLSEHRGKTASPHTSRAYGYHLAHWLTYAETLSLDWKRASFKDLAIYRNNLRQECSGLTKRTLKRETINLRLGVICSFYKFLLRHKYILKLPFDLEEVRVTHQRNSDEMAHLGRFRGKSLSNPLMYRTYERCVDIPTNDDVRNFIHSFDSWRNRLIAEIMWVSGMRRAEVCDLTIFVIPENLDFTDERVVAVRIVGKGSKARRVKLPVNLLRSIRHYVDTERQRLLRKNPRKTDQIWLGRNGCPITPAAINKFFKINEKKCGLKIAPHTIRHNYAVQRLAYLQDHGVTSALKILQGELGHSHLHTTEIYLHETDSMRAQALAEHEGFIASLMVRGNSTNGGSND